MATATKERPCVSISRGIISVGTGGYEVRLADVHSQMELVNWIKHLTRKAGVRLEHITQFIDLVCKAKGWPVDD